MTVKEHYDNHLGNFYSWYTGDFDTNKEAFKTFCLENEIKPNNTKYALDLGAGNGIQTLALAELGFHIKAIDFNKQLITELKSKIGSLPIDVFNDDIRYVSKYSSPPPGLIVCCGDTITHLDSFDEIQILMQEANDILATKGMLILSFRDYSTDLEDTNRFIPVKSDSHRILTCFIEYFKDKLRVTDLLYELDNGKWIQKISSYYKTRLSKELAIEYLQNSGFKIVLNKIMNRIITIIALKNN